jgi:dephospho-CoA kinase
MYVGLTGGIGSGKSTASNILREFGANIIDADELSREALAPGSAIVERVAQEFPGVVNDGVVDRKVLAHVVFNDRSMLHKLEALILPYVHRKARDLRAGYHENQVVIYDSPLIAEHHSQGEFDKVIVVQAPENLRLERLQHRGISREDALARIANQATDEQREFIADYVIWNDKDEANLRKQVEEVWRQLTA